MVPTANRVTIDEPEIAAKKAQDKIHAAPRPPGQAQVAARIILMRRTEMAPCVMIAPQRINSGIESSTSWLSARHMCSTMKYSRSSLYSRMIDETRTTRMVIIFCRSTNNSNTKPNRYIEVMRRLQLQRALNRVG